MNLVTGIFNLLVAAYCLGTAWTAGLRDWPTLLCGVLGLANAVLAALNLYAAVGQ